METPLHFDGGLFSDIRSSDGKLLSKVTVDRVHSSTRCDVIDSPGITELVSINGNKDYVDDIVKTETITNEDVIKVKFTPVLPELEGPQLTPKLTLNRQTTTVKLIDNNFEDLQSYKLVNSLFKENSNNNSNNIDNRAKNADNIGVEVDGSKKRAHSPLANFLVSEQLTKIDNYLQESLNVCSESNLNENSKSITEVAKGETKLIHEEIQQSKIDQEILSHSKNSLDKVLNSDGDAQKTNYHVKELSNISSPIDKIPEKSKSRLNSVKEKQLGIISAIYNMPMHYHAAILCFLLIVYNLIYQYIKHNCYGYKK
ncbi:unnamed protein product [Parnassius apollo]|uniref:(apollo) hypothetical protein n=1 Tax=Parnassius apollo TaxID=110799 RepID=A0A8S3XIC0_PARAO|nr:unnamed protein product [Parnassius apollo]